MRLKSIQLTNFNNYSSVDAVFHPMVNALTGKNGMGKTNMLDAVYYLCIGKSYFSSGDKYVVRKGDDFFRCFGVFDFKDGNEEVEIKVRPGKKKEIILSGKKRERLSDHIGQFPCVIIAPIDIQLMLEGSEERRKLLDITIMQYDRPYVDAILAYNRLLKQRNVTLKMFAEKHYYDQTLLDSISKGMYTPASIIHKMRKQLIEELSPVFQKYYKIISSENETCTIGYSSHLENASLQQLFLDNLERDKIITRTSCGIHKDDIALMMNGEKLKNFASQGQLKSVILALKLAQYEILSNKNEHLPILILDDIFDKLDRSRVEHLLSIVASDNVGQVFISDTHVDRVPQLLTKLKVEHFTFKVDGGQLEKIHS
ncbi:MAG: DNA replication and repair protein RecF [Saprospiraceae bacterium]|nr:DNA replication and repair protein RecF [Saprospiraceae bacterium]